MIPSVLRPVYLWAGDPRWCEESLEELGRRIRAKTPGEIHTQTFYLTENSLDPALAQARTLPFLMSFQILRLKEAQCLKAKNFENLERYLSAPSPLTALIFEAASGLERKHPLVELVQAHGEVRFFDEDTHAPRQGKSFVNLKFTAAGKSVDPAALRRLEEQAQIAPSAVDTILDQLILVSGNARQITDEMVQAFEEKFSEVDGFALIGAIASRKTARALVLLRELLDQNAGDYFSLVGLLHWQIRRFWQAGMLLEKGEPESLVMKKCKVSPRQAPYFLRQLRMIPNAKLAQALEGLFRLDWNLKTGQAEGEAALESWVVSLTGADTVVFK